MSGGVAGVPTRGSPASSEDSVAVLHVDDDPVFRILVQRHLEEKAPLDVTSVEGPDAALDALREGDFDCVVSDHQMPEQTGLDLFEEVRDAHPDLPFILLTGQGSEEIASKAIGAGVTDYVQKEKGPDQFETLAHRIRQTVDKHRTHALAQRTRSFYEALLEHSRDLVSVVDEDGNFLWESPAVEHILGYDPDERVGTNGMEYVHPDDRDALTEPEADGDGRTRLGYRARTAAGEWRWLESVATAEPVPEVGGYVASTRDVTDRKDREHRLQVAETVFRNANDALFLLDIEADGAYRIRRINPAAEEQSGLPADALEGRTLAEAFGQDIREATEPLLERCLEAGEPISFDRTVDHPALPSEWRTTLVPVNGADGTPQIVGITRNLSAERDRVEDAEVAEALLEGTPLPTFVADVGEDGPPTLHRVNTAMEELVGATAEELEGRPPSHLPWTDGAAPERWRLCVETGEPRIHPTVPPDLGGGTTYEIHLRPVEVDGDVTRLVGVLRPTRQPAAETRA